MSYNKTIWKSKDIITREKMQKIEDQLEVLSEQETSGSGSGTSDYLELENKPQINGVTLTGNKSLTDLGVAAASDVAAKYTKPGTGIPASDLSSTVQASLQKADTALQGENLTSVVNNYIETNFSNPSSPPLDRTLSSSASAAPADMVGDLKSAIGAMSSATADDAGKALIAKTINNGYVTDWEFGESGIKPDSIDIVYDSMTNKLFVTIDGIRKGSGVILPSENAVDVDGIIKWYRAAVQFAYASVKDLGDGYVNHVLATDIHYDQNTRHSAAICNLLMDTGFFAKFLILGDLTEGNTETEFDNFVSDGWGEHNGDIIFTVGNHDVMESDPNHPVYDDFYNLLLSRADYASPDLYYTYVDYEHHIKYVAIDTESITASSNDAQLQMIRQAVQDAGWTVFVFAHRNLLVLPEGITWAQSLGNQITDAIIDAMTSGNASIGGYVCGHQHVDIITPVNSKFYHVTLLNDRFETQNYYPGYSVTTRKSGTISEQAVTLFSVNPSTGHVRIQRIGAAFYDRGVWEYWYPKRGTDIVQGIEKYAISYNLTNAYGTAEPIMVDSGASYSANITAENGYTIESIAVTMGGIDITESAVNGNAIIIPSVTGNVIINVTALSDDQNLLYGTRAGADGAILISYDDISGDVSVGNAASGRKIIFYTYGVKPGTAFNFYYDCASPESSWAGGKCTALINNVENDVVKGAKYIRRGFVAPDGTSQINCWAYTSGKIVLTKRNLEYNKELWGTKDVRFLATGDVTYTINADGTLTVNGTPPAAYADATNLLYVGFDNMVSGAYYRVVVKSDSKATAAIAFLDVDDGSLNGNALGQSAIDGFAIKIIDYDSVKQDWISDALLGRGTMRLKLSAGANYTISVQMVENG